MRDAILSISMPCQLKGLLHLLNIHDTYPYGNDRWLDVFFTLSSSEIP